MHETDAPTEWKRALCSVIVAAIMTPAIVALSFTGPQWPVIVYFIGFTVGYIVERLSLSRRIVGLIRQVESLRPAVEQ